jgi:hypothetical protein
MEMKVDGSWKVANSSSFNVMTEKSGVWPGLAAVKHVALRLLVTANVVPSPPILVTLMMEAIRSSKRRYLQEQHGVVFQKTAFFIVTAVKTSNLTLH